MEQIYILFDKFRKSWRKRQAPTSITHHVFPQDKSLCVVQVLDMLTKQEHLEKTKWLNNFNSIVMPQWLVASSAVSGWVKKVLSKASINAGLFKAHSKRLTSTSREENCGTSLSDMLKRGNWSKASTWQKFHRKDIVKISVDFRNCDFDWG